MPSSFQVIAAAIAQGHLPVFVRGAPLPPLAHLVLVLPTGGAHAGLSYASAFVALGLLLDLWAKWRLAAALIERPLAFWLCVSACTALLMPGYFGSLDAIVASLCMLSLASWSRSPEGAGGWLWLAAAIGVGVTPGFLLPIGALWCRERGARWLDVLHGLCLCTMGVAVPLMLAGLLAGAPAMAWWHAFVAEGISPSSTYAALAYVSSGLRGHFLLLPSFGHVVLGGERVAAWARIAPLLTLFGQAAAWWRVLQIRSRALDRVSLTLVATSGAALLLSAPRASASSFSYFTPPVLAWASQRGSRGALLPMALWSWACVCTWQVCGHEVAMAHGESARQLWLAIRTGCIGWLLLECGQRPSPSKSRGGPRATWLVPYARRH